MPSRPVQSLADGFLTLLGVKNMGRLPDTLGDVVTPVAEMAPWYLNAQAQVTAKGTAKTALITGFTAPGTTPIMVPEGQVWWIHQLTVRVDSLPLSTPRIINLAAAALSPEGHWYLGEPATLDDPTGLVGGTVLMPPSLCGFFAPSGTQFGLNASLISNLVAAAESFTVYAYVKYTPMVR